MDVLVRKRESPAVRRVALILGIALAGCPSERAAPPEASPTAKAPETPAQPPPSAEWPKRKASASELDSVRKALEVLVKPGATDPTDPWAMAHGIVAFGPDLKANDGRPAAEALVHDFLLREEQGEAVSWYFPDKTPAGRPLQPHANLAIKTLVTSGLPLDRPLSVRGGKTVTLRAIVDSMESSFERPPTAHDWGRQAWTLETIFVAEEPGTKVQLEGWRPTYAELVGRSVEALASLQAFLDGPMKSGRPDLVEKRKQGIYAHTCGGLHFVQAVIRGTHRLGAPELLDEARAQLDRVRFRYDAERRIYRDAIRSAPKYRVPLLVQELKFYGHVLETYGLAAEWGFITPTPELSSFLADVGGDLADTVRELEPTYGELKAYRTRSAQTYYDLVGDGCHAIRGLRLAQAHFLEADS